MTQDWETLYRADLRHHARLLRAANAYRAVIGAGAPVKATYERFMRIALRLRQTAPCRTVHGDNPFPASYVDRQECEL